MAEDLDGRLRGLATNLSYGRAVVGAAALLAPRITGMLMGFPKDEMTPSAVAMGRFFAVRELVVAGATLRAVAAGGRDTPVFAAHTPGGGGAALGGAPHIGRPRGQPAVARRAGACP